MICDFESRVMMLCEGILGEDEMCGCLAVDNEVI